MLNQNKKNFIIILLSMFNFKNKLLINIQLLKKNYKNYQKFKITCY